VIEGIGLRGHPVRVTIMDEASGERRYRVSGSVRETGPEGWTVDLVDSIHALDGGTPVALEVLVQGDLLWTTTVLQASTSARASSLTLAVPGALHRGQRRVHPRVDLSLPFHIQRQPTRELIPARLRDLSAGGASFSASANLAVGERVQLILALGSGLFLQNLEAEVLRGTDASDLQQTCAVRFHCDERQEALLAGWVSRQLPGGIPAAGQDESDHG
jgi:hypothetical protein